MHSQDILSKDHTVLKDCLNIKMKYLWKFCRNLFDQWPNSKISGRTSELLLFSINLLYIS